MLGLPGIGKYLTMRKVLITLSTLLIIFAVLIAAAWWWLLRQPDSVGIADTLPQHVDGFMELRDGVSTTLRYRQSDLKRVYESDEVKAMLALIFGSIQVSAEENPNIPITAYQEKLESLGQVLSPQLSGRSFLAFDIQEPTKEFAETIPFQMLLGLQPRPALAHPEELLTWIDENFFADLPEQVKIVDDSYQEIPYQTIRVQIKDESIPFPLEAHLIVHDGWFLFGIGKKLTHSFLDNVVTPGTHPVLASHPEFIELSSHREGPAPDMVMFFQADSIVDNLFKQISALSMAGAGADSDEATEETRKHLEKQLALQERSVQMTLDGLHGIYLTWSFDGRRLEGDSWMRWEETPGRKRSLGPLAPLAHDLFALTNPDTLIYASASFDLTAQIDYLDEVLEETMKQMNSPSGNTSEPGMDNWRGMINSGLKPLGLDIDRNIIDPIGNEVAYVVDWHSETPHPTGTLALAIDEKEPFDQTFKLLGDAVANMGAAMPTAGITRETIDDLQALFFSTPMIKSLSPGLFYDGSLFGMVSDRETLKKQMASGTSSTLLDAKGIDPMVSKMKKGSFRFSHIRTAEITRRGYPAILNLLNEHGKKLENEKLNDWIETFPEELSFTDALGNMTTASYGKGDLIKSRTVMNGDPLFPLALFIAAGLSVADDDLSKAFQKATTTPAEEGSESGALAQPPERPLNKQERAVLGLWQGQRAGLSWEIERKADRTFQIAMVDKADEDEIYRNYGEGVWWIENNMFVYQWQKWSGDDGELSEVGFEPISTIEENRFVTLSPGEEKPENVEIRIEKRTMPEWTLKEKPMTGPGAEPSAGDKVPPPASIPTSPQTVEDLPQENV